MPRAPHIVVLVGSLREGSNTGRAAALLADEARAAAPGATVDVVDPRQVALAVPHAPGQETAADALSVALRARVAAADAVVVATPEYDGSYSAVTKILIEHLGYPSLLAGKPVAVVGVASGRVGAQRAVEHLRSLLLHIGALVLPRPCSIAAVHRCFDEAGRCVDAGVAAALRDVGRQVARFAASGAAADPTP